MYITEVLVSLLFFPKEGKMSAYEIIFLPVCLPPSTFEPIGRLFMKFNRKVTPFMVTLMPQHLIL
jgi:hypothetical protein